MALKLAASNVLVKVLGLLVIVGIPEVPASSQHFTSHDRELAQTMLEVVASDVHKDYYDRTIHGIDWDAKVREARDEIAKATSMAEAYARIAATLEILSDSHTFFLPPGFDQRVDYGWRFQMVGDRCYVTQVRPRSDAQAKGLQPGDRVLTIDGFAPTRDSLWKMKYALDVLSPQRSLQVELLKPSRKLLKVDIQASVRRTQTLVDLDDMSGKDSWRLSLIAEEARRIARVQYAEMGPDLMIMKLPQVTQTFLEIDGLVDRARKHKALIMDLRGNPGGNEESLQNWLAGMFASDVKIAERLSRGARTSFAAKGNHNHAFSGKLIVLVDSESASAAELFARVVQIEKRGIILGDHTSGATMEAIMYEHATGINPTYSYAAMVTKAELVMTDGKSLEHLGVTPDETILPAATDLAGSGDPVMTRAAEMAGVKLDPEHAAKLFPREWPKDSAFPF